MKTEFLKTLGIEDQSVIDQIMAENGRDVNAAKKAAEGFEAQIEDLKKQISDRDTQLKDLKKSAVDNSELTNKITQLENDNKAAKKAYEDKITEMQKNHAVESAVRDAKAKNVKAVTALLDFDKIVFADGKLVGLDEQIKALTEGEDTGFLFGESQPAPPAGAQPGNTPNGNIGGSTPQTGNRELGGISLSEGIASFFKGQ